MESVCHVDAIRQARASSAWCDRCADQQYWSGYGWVAMGHGKSESWSGARAQELLHWGYAAGGPKENEAEAEEEEEEEELRAAVAVV